MLIYHRKLSLNLEKYGIGVPLRNSRDQKCFDELKAKFSEQITETQLGAFPPIEKEDLLRVHDDSYINDLYMSLESLAQRITDAYELETYALGERISDFRDFFETIFLHCRGSYLSILHSLENSHKFSYLLGGGMHHAMSFGGRGFCLLHDGVIALEKARAADLFKTAWVVDVDAHKGDGTAELAQSRPWLKTLSLHMQSSWPFGQIGENAESPWMIPSDIDVGFRPKEEEHYLPRLDQALNEMEKKFGMPDVVWVVAGADVYEQDELLSSRDIQLSLPQILERDQYIFDFFKKRNISQAWCLGGGYGEQTWKVPTQFLDWVLRGAPSQKN